MRYLALLRGINVGGNNLISMAELRTCLEQSGFRNVTTYIQSGNVLFETTTKNKSALERKIERILSDRFTYEATIVLISDDELKAVIEEAPAGFGLDPAAYRYDVVFLKTPLRAREVLPTIALKEGVDEAFGQSCVLYFQRLLSRATQSKMSKLVAHPGYKEMTIRNWNTTSKLCRMMNGEL